MRPQPSLMLQQLDTALGCDLPESWRSRLRISAVTLRADDLGDERLKPHPETLVSRADAALYKPRQSSRDCSTSTADYSSLDALHLHGRLQPAWGDGAHPRGEAGQVCAAGGMKRQPPHPFGELSPAFDGRNLIVGLSRHCSLDCRALETTTLAGLGGSPSPDRAGVVNQARR
jgi:hypothetical protein